MNAAISAVLWILLWVGFLGLVLLIVRVNPRSPDDDEEQVKAVSRPAPLHPHVSAKNYWTKS